MLIKFIVVCLECKHMRRSMERMLELSLSLPTYKVKQDELTTSMKNALNSWDGSFKNKSKEAPKRGFLHRAFCKCRERKVIQNPREEGKGNDEEIVVVERRGVVPENDGKTKDEISQNANDGFLIMN